jgi:ribosomal protein S18 acetylase RimI-like enzyme
VKDGIDVMTIADYEQVAAVWEEVEMWPHAAEDREWLGNALARNPTSSLVWRENGRVVGTAIGAWDGMRGWVYHLAVTGSCRGRGIGSRLLSAAEEALRAVGARQINLMVHEENHFAHELYLRRGYEPSPVNFLRKRFCSAVAAPSA